jgi:hypothetical protein
MRATASAANSTIAPCAKLNTPEALKISTKPSATSEYITPAISPPSSTSMKKPGAALRWKRRDEADRDHGPASSHQVGSHGVLSARRRGRRR